MERVQGESNGCSGVSYLPENTSQKQRPVTRTGLNLYKLPYMIAVGGAGSSGEPALARGKRIIRMAIAIKNTIAITSRTPGDPLNRDGRIECPLLFSTARKPATTRPHSAS